jgi:hypothetical protein
MTIMTRFEKWILRCLIRRNACEGCQEQAVVAIMQHTRDVIQELYTEDNIPTTDAFMMFCFDQTQKSPWWKEFVRNPTFSIWK